MAKFPCPYLSGKVELNKEREKHIAERHPDLLPAYRKCIAETLADPDQVRRSARFGNALLFYRWFDEVRGGKFVAIVVITNARHWIVTAYIIGELSKGEIIWMRS